MTIGFDSMCAAHLLNEELPLSLKSVAGVRLGVSNWGKGVQKFGEGKTPPTPLYGDEGMGLYCARDTAYAHLVFEEERDQLMQDQDRARLFKRLILPGLEAYVQMELNGIWVDFDKVAANERKMREKFDTLSTEVLGYVPPVVANPDISNEHFLRKWLFSWDGTDSETKGDVFNDWGLGLPIYARTDKTRAPQVDEKALKALTHPAVEALVARKHLMKGFQFFESWREWADADGRLHPFFNLTGTVTGRRSCDRPNLQQVPRDRTLRSCLGAPPGWVFLEVDYSQIEVRLAAWEADEDTMLRIFSDPDGDIYRYTAAKLMSISEAELRDGLRKGEAWAKLGRQKAKAVVLGFLYGMGSSKFGVYAKEMYGVDLTDQEAVDFRNTFFELYPKLQAWHNRQRRAAGWVGRYEEVPKDCPYQVESAIGRIRHLRRGASPDWVIAGKAHRQAINSPIQGLGGDLTLASVVSLHALMARDEIMVVGDVHDALLFQIRQDVWKKWTAQVLKTMEGVPIIRELVRQKSGRDIPVRLKAEAKVGYYWAEPRTRRGDEFVPEFSLEELDGLELEPRAA